MPIQDSDYFLIDDNGVSKKIRADNLKAGIHSTHSDKKLLVNLSNQYTSRFVYAGDVTSKVNSDHWMLINRGNTTSYKVSGDKVANYLKSYKRIHYTGTGLDNLTIPILDAFHNTTGTGESMLWFLPEVIGISGMIDTIRGNSSMLNFMSDKEVIVPDLITYGTNSFSLRADDFTHSYTHAATAINRSGKTYKVWQFKSQPGFFDIVQWDGNSSTRTLQHSLGEAPGMIMIQEYSGNQSNQNWSIYHSSLGANKLIYSNDFVGSNSSLNGYTPTATDFQVTSSTIVNSTGNKYIAYLFADNSSAGIKCGSYSTPTSVVDVGFRPEAVIVKKVAGSGGNSFVAFDDTNDKVLIPNSGSPIQSNYDNSFLIHDSGFTVNSSYMNQPGSYVYMAVK